MFINHDFIYKILEETKDPSNEEIKEVLAGKKIDRTEQTPVPPEKQTKVSVPEV